MKNFRDFEIKYAILIKFNGVIPTPLKTYQTTSYIRGRGRINMVIIKFDIWANSNEVGLRGKIRATVNSDDFFIVAIGYFV